ncbi:hypothetical protein [Sphingomonas immobilis]|uniref:Uncharacterized protein n=1 Tax=Sphingomonas immobilis TaxID=3063997 RepID=A0ABT9A2F3_9SPHN|nr:hypothetical protein [Sphingomonas sp. CA1-15]MDO7844014.1 hypothetical protein [Sphingomonas sp. CA1-15]
MSGLSTVAIVRLLMLVGAAWILLAGWTVRARHRFDAIILIGAGLILLGHLIFWQFGLVFANRFLAPFALLFSPPILYLVAFVFCVCFFVTKVRGWPRAVYLAGSIVVLSPLIFLFVVLPAAFLTHH